MLTATFTSSEVISFCISTIVSVELVRAAALHESVDRSGKSQTVYLLLVLLVGHVPLKN